MNTQKLQIQNEIHKCNYTNTQIKYTNTVLVQYLIIPSGIFVGGKIPEVSIHVHKNYFGEKCEECENKIRKYLHTI